MDLPRTEGGKLDVRALVAGHEQWFEHGPRRIPYMFFPCSGRPERRRLFVSFGAWGGGYNRVRGYFEALQPTHDLLFLQDNHDPEKKGVWYLAERGDFSVEEAYTALIASTVGKSGAAREDVWLLGSSMGGFAALYFAYKLDLGRAVAMCPVIAIHNLYKDSVRNRVCEYVIGDSGVDVDAHIFRNFDRNVSTEAHIMFNRDDLNMINSHVGRLLEIMVRNRNKFTVQTFDIRRPENVSPHNSAMGIMGREGILALFERSLAIDYRADQD